MNGILQRFTPLVGRILLGLIFVLSALGKITGWANTAKFMAAKGMPFAQFFLAMAILLELGGAFTAALAVQGGRIVDGLGGSSGPLGLRAAGAMDAEVAYLLGGSISKDTVFSGGALDIAGDGVREAEALIEDARYRDAWQAFVESAAKAVLALTAVLPAPREVLLSGRLSSRPAVVTAFAERLSHVAPVRAVQGLGARAKAAAQGAALLADGLAGGRYAPLVEAMELRSASGTALDYLRLNSKPSLKTRWA